MCEFANTCSNLDARLAISLHIAELALLDCAEKFTHDARKNFRLFAERNRMPFDSADAVKASTT
jgi:hypothetical protein